ncbi:type II toxin-antitoxin system HipA family toxin [Thiospirochaeta perfilievii]|uniref:Type II toxin-antitoxin system HipA family toxin n=1 Tax=Thiospirochaeta perfilievii TaxID=252967 RepID=A0A5C1Q9U3_9SPIO|nr:HipA domain-containing protein [Thiospirochaeta perfilievii]QEN03414.1 type II toxin-antitoxin system HipA family toxin [Thiospirochaeta perfilievii]
MICRLTLENIDKETKIRKIEKDFFGKFRPIYKLNFSRKEFFTKGIKFTNGMSISGVQQKLSLILNSDNEFEIVTIGGEYILKPSPESFPYAAENEQCAMSLSRFLGIDTALSANIQFLDEEEVYITKRYDRNNGEKIHQEDLAQAFNIKSQNKYNKSYEEALILVRKMCGGKLSVVKELFNRIVFAYLIGNDDMHLKNISLIKYKDNKTAFYDGLTPNYDQLLVHAFPNPSTIGVLALDLTKAEDDGIYSDSFNKYGFYTGSDFYLLGELVGIRKPVIKKILENFINNKNGIIEIINHSFMPKEMKLKAKNLIIDRLKAISIIT